MSGPEGLTPAQAERRDRAIDLSVRAFLDVMGWMPAAGESAAGVGLGAPPGGC